jgi:hypothetical protein
MGVEPTTTILETAALPLSYGSFRRSFYDILNIFQLLRDLDGPKFAGYRTKTKGWLVTVKEPAVSAGFVRK